MAQKKFQNKKMYSILVCWADFEEIVSQKTIKNSCEGSWWGRSPGFLRNA